MALGDTQRVQTGQSLLNIFNKSISTGDSLSTTFNDQLAQPKPANRLTEGMTLRREKALSQQEQANERKRQIQNRIDENFTMRSEIEKLNKENASLQDIDKVILENQRDELFQQSDTAGTTQPDKPEEQPETSQADKVEVESALETIGRGFKQFGFQAQAAAAGGVGGTLNTLVDIGEMIGAVIGLDDPRSKVFDKIAQTFLTQSEEFTQLAKDEGIIFANKLLGSAIGGAVPGIFEFNLDIPFATLQGASEEFKKGGSKLDILTGAAVGGVKRSILGKVFTELAPLRRDLRALSMGTAFAADPIAAGGTGEEVAEAFGTGILFAQAGGKGRVGPKELFTPEARKPIKVDLKGAEAETPIQAELKRVEKEAVTPKTTDTQIEINAKVENSSETQIKDVYNELASKKVDDFISMDEIIKLLPKVPLVPGSITVKQLKNPRFVGSINLSKLNITQPQIEMMRELQKMTPAEGKQTWDETGRLANEILADYKKTEKLIRKLKKGEGGSTIELAAIKQLNVNALQRMSQLEPGENISREEYTRTVNAYKENIFKPLRSVSSEVARATNYHKQNISPTRISKAFSEMEKGLRPDQQQRFKNLDMNDPVAVKDFINSLKDPLLQDYMWEYWYNNVLSGIPTHTVNTVSNTGWFLYQIPHRGLTGLVDASIAKFTGRERSVYANEMLPLLAGYKNSKSAFWDGLDVIRTGRSAKFESKWNLEIGQRSISAFENSPHKILRTIAPAISMSSRALRAADVFFNSISVDAELNAQARRASNKKGLIAGNERVEFEREFKEKPPQKALDAAVDFGKHSVFMDDPDSFTKQIIDLRAASEKDSPQGRILKNILRTQMPFVNTIGNLLKRSIELTPGGAILRAKSLGPGVGLEKGKSVLAETISKTIEASALTYWVWQLMDDDKITGATPRDKAEREAFFRQGKLPHSIKIGENWYQYDRVEPWGQAMSMIVGGREEVLNAKNDDTALKIGANIGISTVNNIIDSSYLTNLNRTLKDFSREQTAADRLEKQVANTMTGFIAYSSFFRSLSRSTEVALESGFFGESGAKVRNAKTFQDVFSLVIPGASTLVEPRLNVWGEEINLQGGILRQWSPFKFTTETTDPLEIELQESGFYPSHPQQTLTVEGEKIKLSTKEYRDYLIQTGKALKEDLTDLINSRSYQRATLDEKRGDLKSQLLKTRSRIRNEQKDRLIRK